MVERLRGLGLPGVTARTFHAHALSQLRHFWPLHHDGAAAARPARLEAAAARAARPRAARPLPVHPGQGPRRRDRVGQEPAPDARRRTSATPWPPGREPPIPVDLFVRMFAGYERAKTRAGRIDFDDLMAGTVDLLETDAEAAELVRARKRWFSVDEYQDTNPLQQRLLELWLGDRRDLCVVGDEDQTIYTFTGATSALPDLVRGAPSGRARRHPRPRTTARRPQVLALANRLLASTGRDKRLVATRPDGPGADHRAATRPRRRARPRSCAGSPAAWGRGPRRPRSPSSSGPTPSSRPIEAALTRAGIAVPGPRPALLRPPRGPRRDRPRAPPARRRRAAATSSTPSARCWAERLGYDDEPGDGRAGDEARERTAALDTLLDILERLVAGRRRHRRGDLPRRARAAPRGRARGLGRRRQPADLPPGQGPRVGRRRAAGARGGPAAASARPSTTTPRSTRSAGCCTSGSPGRGATSPCRGRPSARPAAGRPAASRAGSWPTCGRGRARGERRVRELPGPPLRAVPVRAGADEDPLMAALRAWRTGRAREDAVPPYVVAHDATLAAIAEARPRERRRAASGQGHRAGQGRRLRGRHPGHRGASGHGPTDRRSRAGWCLRPRLDVLAPVEELLGLAQARGPVLDDPLGRDRTARRRAVRRADGVVLADPDVPGLVVADEQDGRAPPVDERGGHPVRAAPARDVDDERTFGSASMRHAPSRRWAPRSRSRSGGSG